jgi:hypothetical protein
MKAEKMNVEKGMARTPEIGQLWLNSPPLEVIR